VAAGEQTRIGSFFDRHPHLLRTLALIALIWGAGYLVWRVGWSGEGANPIAFAMLLATEVYGLYALAILAWFSWSRPRTERPAATPGRKIDVYVCTYDEPAEVVMATLAGCRALTYPHTTYLLDDGRRPLDRRSRPGEPGEDRQRVEAVDLGRQQHRKGDRVGPFAAPADSPGEVAGSPDEGNQRQRSQQAWVSVEETT